MHDPRHDALARILTRYSTELKKGDNVLIEGFDIPHEMTVALIRAARACGATPFARTHAAPVARELALGATEAQYDLTCELELALIRKMDAYIAVRGSHNVTELSDVPADKMQLAARKLKPALDHRVRKTRWVVLRWPTPAMAQQAGMSTEQFERFFFDVCTLDYRPLRKAMLSLKRLMERSDTVEIKGPGTDLRFSIKNIPAVLCEGKRNIPDGEVFTAPVRDSVQGHVTFNTPTLFQGAAFDNVRLTFKAGRIVEAESSDTARLNRILDSDPGARYTGEFSFGFNPRILHPMRDILFDEKIAGSFHLTPGQAYDVADNGNRSQVHWDLVCIQRRDYGGGTIALDGEVIRRDGLFLPSALQPLNPPAATRRRPA